MGHGKSGAVERGRKEREELHVEYKLKPYPELKRMPTSQVGDSLEDQRNTDFRIRLGVKIFL